MEMMSTPKSRKVLVLDVQSVWLPAVEKILDAAGFATTSTSSAANALQQVRRGSFDVLMFSVDSGDERLGWTQLLSRAKKLAPATKLIVVGSDADPGVIQRAFELGADAYLLRRAEPEDLVFATRQVLQPGVYHLWPLSRSRRPSRQSSDRPFGLTRREGEVLGLIAQGRSNAQIARELKITEQTVKGHLWRLYRKLEVKNRTAAARWAEKVARS
jgi:DNA-binding NarL/FixJ family response regulator